MDVITTVSEMREQAKSARRVGKKLALVPTMGALHKGHLSLVQNAMDVADHVTVSVFVNPTQFGPSEDFTTYPREQEADLQQLRAMGGVDAVFMPTVAEMYPYGQESNVTWVTVDQLDQHLCGQFRDGHFRGVTTVVSRLFNACMPHKAVFGLKDAQQFFILRRMVKEQLMDVELIGVDTYREDDGLAASSRNVYLSEEHRQQAPAIQKALQDVQEMILGGERDPDVIRRYLNKHIGSNTEGTVQYAEVVDTMFIQPVDRIKPGEEILVAVAVFFGKTRLIDNVIVHVPAN